MESYDIKSTFYCMNHYHKHYIFSFNELLFFIAVESTIRVVQCFCCKVHIDVKYGKFVESDRTVLSLVSNCTDCLDSIAAQKC